KYITNLLSTFILCESTLSILHTDECVIQREKSPGAKGLKYDYIISTCFHTSRRVSNV
uniref:Ovule protein n=1 Tax=Strongyloides papillosus TaxID=174720 RepID=A0A0N5C6B4_STREA